MKRTPVTVLLIIVLALALSGNGAAKGKPEVGGSMLALGIAPPFQIHANTVDITEKTQTDVQNYTVSWPARATTGWHYHVGWLVVVITAGAVTTYNETKTGCVPVTYRKGQVFVEPPFRVHNAVNLGHVAASGVTSEFITHGKQETVNVARPANCPQI